MHSFWRKNFRPERRRSFLEAKITSRKVEAFFWSKNEVVEKAKMAFSDQNETFAAAKVIFWRLKKTFSGL